MTQAKKSKGKAKSSHTNKRQRADIKSHVSSRDLDQLRKPKSESESLATRRNRLFAHLIDVSPGFLCIFLQQVFGSDFEEKFDAAAALPYMAFVVLNIYLLVKYGQTIGKYFRSIQVVNFKTNEIPHWATLVFVRPLLPAIYSGWLWDIGKSKAVFVGSMAFFLIDLALIFRPERRCLHDLLAGTKVVNCDPRSAFKVFGAV